MKHISKYIVTSYRVFEKRDSLSSIKAAYSTLVKYDKLSESLKVISDSNPIYNVLFSIGVKMAYHLNFIKSLDLQIRVILLKNIEVKSKSLNVLIVL